MSSAPAVPTSSTQSAPTTHIESTQEAPHGQSVSGIGHDGAGPEEAMLHTGAFNSIDIYMRMQFLALASFAWTTQQAPGTLLWQAPIKPQNSHQFIRHLALMYNTWVGGFDYNIKVCGTGFHAGALAIVRLPPNIQPSSVTSPADFTAFEYIIIDPKTLEVVTEHIIDQRRTMYHYMNDTGMESSGGYIAVYVLVQLNTSSTGSQQIAVQVLTRPSQQFNFFQIKPIESKGGPDPEPDEPRALAEAFNVGGDCLNSTAIFTDEIKRFTVMPKSQANPLASQAGCYKFSGAPVNTTLDNDQFPLKSLARSNATLSESTFIPTAFMNLPLSSNLTALGLWHRDESGRYQSENISAMTAIGTFKIEPQLTTGTKDSFMQIEQYIEKTQEVPLKPAEESFFVFDTSNTTQHTFSYQTLALARLLHSGEFKDMITPQEAIIFDIYDKELDTPIRRIKLYYNGHVTTTGLDDQRDLIANKYYFKFVQISRAGEPIPAPPKHNTNYRANEIMSLWRSEAFKQN